MLSLEECLRLLERRVRSRGQAAAPSTAQPVETEEQTKVTLRNHPQISSVSITPSANTSPLKPLGNLDKKSKKRGRKFTKSDISNPTNFIHVSHVGWNAQKGFDMVGSEDDEMLKNFFTKAGVSDKEVNRYFNDANRVFLKTVFGSIVKG